MQTNTLSHQDNTTQEKDTIPYPRSFLNHDSISSAFVEELLKLEDSQSVKYYIRGIW
ncbi:hypothetical protein [Helicobacter trogontum]|uniref:hypothetical protein n=1 Tax=Helicobacter trogontum TaxID=50960 RepID=UPI002A91AFDE|nr:hypothetical protein [Helicobacter trogontum]MDY5185384.1 hypothetical protein [Helicobacter trogontum]